MAKAVSRSASAPHSQILPSELFRILSKDVTRVAGTCIPFAKLNRNLRNRHSRRQRAEFRPAYLPHSYVGDFNPRLQPFLNGGSALKQGSHAAWLAYSNDRPAQSRPRVCLQGETRPLRIFGELRDLSRTNKLYRARIKTWLVSAQRVVCRFPNAFERRSEGGNRVLTRQTSKTYTRTLRTNEIQCTLFGALSG